MNKDKIIEVIRNEFKGQAMNEWKSDCAYLSPDGKKCAIGIFIPDGHMAFTQEYGVEELLAFYPDLKKHMPSSDVKLLGKFQEVHDNLNAHSSVEEQRDMLIKFVMENF